MRTLASLLLAASIASCAPPPERTGEVYGAHVRIVRWDALADVTHTISPRKDLAVAGANTLTSAGAPDHMEDRVWKAVRDVRGVEDAAAYVAELSIPDTIALDRDIVAAWITYPEKEILQPLQQRNATLGEYLDAGIGDCSQYAASFAAVFDVLRTHNPRLRDVVVTDRRLSGKDFAHDWNIIVVPTRWELLVAHVDVTQYDNGEAFAGEAESHYGDSAHEVAAEVYAGLGDRPRSLQHYFARFDELYDSFVAERIALHAGDADARDRALDAGAHLTILLEDVGRDAYLRNDLDTLERLRSVALRLSPTLPGLDRLTYYTAVVEEKQGYPQTAAAMRKILQDRFPDSSWTAKLNE